MAIADSYDYLPFDDDSVKLNIEIHQSIWTEASKLRESGELINFADLISIPVVAIHGDYDAHPIDGVKIPLSKRLTDFRIITITKCGHTPWHERFAKNIFFEILRKELAN
ncbi:alpha/beta fold hydrolase [Alkalitalea saponilacus]|uniref:Alpha/beta hydrolase family protein n=1 Tax=Alkalitalea saponilacus TaxID=889453 RepID=A0A1T5HU58_9BACT|nr:alpha/beta hydrolase [Alkalitalea saponilacus]ASB50264.1 hypothetical protein CDL62_14525 [Alkalitalea saponilacus]SKC24205.1 hypothetical protein SAMN03080601_03498 [Alkalitalea saponilacus]